MALMRTTTEPSMNTTNTNTRKLNAAAAKATTTITAKQLTSRAQNYSETNLKQQKLEQRSVELRVYKWQGTQRNRNRATSWRHHQHQQQQHQQQQQQQHYQFQPTLSWLWLLWCLNCMVTNSMADCPNLCECKWKSGKESVLCLNANLTHIPTPLDAGTQVLDLTGNEIDNIPHDTFAKANLLNLQKVYLAKCRLRMIERYAFRKLINLVDLDLSYNQLTSIPTLTFDAIPELRELKLNGNPIFRVQNDAFIKVHQLVRLDLSDCRITVVEVRAFAGLESSLEWLRLDGNKLSEVRSGTITSLTNLHGIELARNFWNCSCSLRPLRAWMLRENIPYGIPPLCRAPPRLAGRTWDKVELDDFACVPQIIATDTTAHGVEGRNVTMSCYVEGVPEPSVRWMVKNRVIANLTASGDPLTALPRTAAATQGRKTYVVNMLRNASNLTILTADMQDAGIYTCAAENKAGKVEASVTLAVSRRPPEAPLGVKIVLLCILTALLFVVGSSFAAICFCSLRRKRKMRLWNSVPPARTESYEKIEMTTRASSGGGGSGNSNDGASGKPDFGGSNRRGGGGGGGGGSGGIGGGIGAYCSGGEENGYLRTATTPLCGSDDGIAIVNPSSAAHVKRNGDYRNIPTHCDDDGTGYEDDDVGVGFALSHSSTSRWKGASLRTSPRDSRRKASTGSGSGSGTCGSITTGAATATSIATTAITMTAKDAALDETDLHIPRLIDIGSNPESASSSISSQVDAAARLGGYTHVPTWTSQIATTKIHSPHSKKDYNTSPNNSKDASGPYYGAGNNDVNTSVFCSTETGDHDLFDSNYPDLLDIAKYAVAQATNNSNQQYPAVSSQMSSSGLCTLPRKLKSTGKYFKSSSDSQSPLLADNSSKYGSSTLGDAGFLNEVATFGRRYSAESSYSNYGSSTMYTTGQRSNSFLNLVQSCNKNGNGMSLSSNAALTLSNAAAAAAAAAAASAATPRRNPSLPSSPVHDAIVSSIGQQQQQHQRSFSSAATPLLDFSSLTTRTGASASPVPLSVAGSSNSATPDLHSTTTVVTSSSSSSAYDYHAAQLERFLEEYRNLQDQLCKMKETCETIRKKEAPLRGALGHSAAQLADPVMFNAAMAAGSPTAHPKTTMLKNKAILPGQPPDPPPYWLHRNAMLKRLNDSQTDIFKS